MSTVKVNCKCENAYQDKAYGKGVRVANTTPKGDARCTVCGAVHHDKASPQRIKK
jgi:hypothetical protein